MPDDIYCPHCAEQRSRDLSTPCPLCGSKMFRIGFVNVGYRYPDEGAASQATIYIILALIGLFVALGIAFTILTGIPFFGLS